MQVNMRGMINDNLLNLSFGLNVHDEEGHSV